MYDELLEEDNRLMFRRSNVKPKFDGALSSSQNEHVNFGNALFSMKGMVSYMLIKGKCG